MNIILQSLINIQDSTIYYNKEFNNSFLIKTNNSAYEIIVEFGEIHIFSYQMNHFSIDSYKEISKEDAYNNMLEYFNNII